MRLHLAAAIAVAAMSLASSASALTPLSGSNQLETKAFVNFLAATDTRVQQTSWTATPQNLLVAVGSQANYQNDEVGFSLARVTGVNRAQWSEDGSSGALNLIWGWGFSQSGGDGSPDPMLKGASFTGLNPIWSYTFRADGDGLFRWEGQIRPDPRLTANNTFGLSGWNLQLNGVTVIDLFDVSGAGPRLGDRDFDLVAGETYTFSLINRSNIAGSNFGRDYRGQMLGEFYWDIVERPPTAVPEPGTWALLIGGFGLTGAALRRRRGVDVVVTR